MSRCGKCNGRILAEADGTRYCISCGWNEHRITAYDTLTDRGVMRQVCGQGDYQHATGQRFITGTSFYSTEGRVLPVAGRATARSLPSQIHTKGYKISIEKRKAMSTGRAYRRLRKEWFL